MTYGGQDLEGIPGVGWDAWLFRVGFEVQLILDKRHVTGVVLGEDQGQKLGLSTWMGARRRLSHASETVFEISSVPQR